MSEHQNASLFRTPVKSWWTVYVDSSMQIQLKVLLLTHANLWYSGMLVL
jgi:hypothetical protein